MNRFDRRGRSLSYAPPQRGHQLAELDPSLARLPVTEVAAFLDRSARLWNPVILDQVNVHSPTGNDVHLSVVGLGMTAGQIVQAMQSRDVKWIMEKLEKSVALSVMAGAARWVSEDSRPSSPTTANASPRPGEALTTGNSLSIGMGLRAIEQAAWEAGIDLRTSRLAVVGPIGNIASTYAQMIAPLVGEVVLVGRDRSSSRLATSFSNGSIHKRFSFNRLNSECCPHW